MSELGDFFNALLHIGNGSGRRSNRVFSRGFVTLMIIVAVFEIAILSAWAKHQ